MIELKRCPFCGGEAEIRDGEFINGHFVFCTQCHIQTKLYTLGNTREKAINDWNTRKPVERILERLEEKETEYRERAKEELDEFCLEMFHSYEDEADGLKRAIEIIKEEV